MSHFYVLSLSSPSGGAPKEFYYVYSSLVDIKNALQEDLQNDPYQLLWYGEEILLITFIDSKSVHEIRLLPFIKATIEGYPESRFNQAGEIEGFDPKQDQDSDDEEKYYQYEQLTEALFLNTIPVEIVVDWAAIVVPELPETGRLKPGKRVEALWNDEDWEWVYGENDEIGDYNDEELDDDDDDE